MFPEPTYTQRRAALCSALDGGLVLLLGNSESPMNYADNCHRFRQDSTFLYFFGLDQPDLAAVIDTDEGAATVFGDELTIDDVVWTGDLPTIAARAAACGVKHTLPAADLPGVLERARATGRPIHFLPPYRAANKLKLMDLLGIAPAEAGARASRPLIEAVVAQRSVKAPEEIEQIERAVDVSVAMHLAAMRMVRPGVSESAIAAEVTRVAEAAGCRLSYPVIATVRGQVLHNHHHDGVLESGDLFLLDAGAEGPLGYAADLSSTVPVDPDFTPRQRLIYDLCLDSYHAAVDALGPGVPNRDVHFAAARVIAEGMKGLGLMKGDTAEAVAAGAHAMFFPCGVGHMMGLDVHDMEDLGEAFVGYDGRPRSTQFGLKSLRLARPLRPGFVLTVEPGIYFIPQLMDAWRASGHCAEFLDFDELDKWRDFGGIRNEENWLITPDGKRRLGMPKPLTAAETASARAGTIS